MQLDLRTCCARFVRRLLTPRHIGAAAALAAMLFFTADSLAAPINYGDFDDIPPGAVMYLDVTESSATDPTPLYGEPDVLVNTIDFDPLEFAAVSTGLGPLDITDGQLNFTVMTVPGAGLDSFFFSEGGDYSLSGLGGIGTSVSASLSVRVEILEVDNEPLPAPIVLVDSDFFYNDLDLSGGPTGLKFWDLDVFMDFGPAIDFLDPELGVTKAEVAIDNQLTANSQRNSGAFIAKKDFKGVPGGDLDPNEIPEPTAAVLLLTGVFGVSARRRR
ncbi:MAG: PEP-CTERM sorting domain-containing protein [Planctomycetota bacterium]